jgi:hypothetical protein
MTSSLLDFAIGMIALYLFASLFVTIIQELVAQIFALRARTLRKGLQESLGDIEKLYHSPLFVSLKTGGLFASLGRKAYSKDPSNISAARFAAAIINTYGRSNAKALDSSSPEFIKVLLAVAGGNADAFRVRLESWFDERMERISGVYKRLSMILSLLIGFAVAIIGNIDSFKAGQYLLARPSEAAAIAAEVIKVVDANAARALDNKSDAQTLAKAFAPILARNGFPIGWQSPPADLSVFLAMLFSLTGLGWLATALATSLGASFWFDTLKRFVMIRSNGGVGGSPSSTKTGP